MRVDRFLARELSISRSRVQRHIRLGNVRVNGETVRPNRILAPEEIVEYDIPMPAGPSLAPEPIDLTIRYEDDSVIVIEKPPGMVVHPAPGSPDGTLVNALLYRFPEMSFPAGDPRPGIVHRLDKDTSGLLVVAKNETVKAELSRSIMERKVQRRYLALVWGHLKARESTIVASIGRHPTDRGKMSTFGTSPREAETWYRVESSFDVCELLDVRLRTGRTHQIRVHLSSIGHPVVGDRLYGGGEGREKGFTGEQRAKVRSVLSRIDRQALHAYRLEFPHPDDGRPMRFESEPPDDLAGLLAYLRASAGETG